DASEVGFELNFSSIVDEGIDLRRGFKPTTNRVHHSRAAHSVDDSMIERKADRHHRPDLQLAVNYTRRLFQSPDDDHHRAARIRIERPVPLFDSECSN